LREVVLFWGKGKDQGEEVIKNPWKTISTKIVYENLWITVREDQVVRPDGNPGIYGVVETRTATGVVALNEKNEVTLVGQYRYPNQVYSWEIPEGGTEDNEDPLACIKRELLEEAGVTAESWVQLGGEIHLSNCHSSEVGFVYLAENLIFGSSAPDGTEVIETKQVPLARCVEMVHSGEIADSLTIIGILRADRYIRERT
jgi:8-oxo-dGTP pyrophosphatase MutT (NUDIX family)